LIPGVGLAADIRDLGAAVGHIAEGKEGAWLEMGASIIGFVPGGDIAKGIAKGVTKATTKAATKVGVELVDDAAKVLKGSTATAADGLTSAQKTAGKVNAPTGPPALSSQPGLPFTKTGKEKVWQENAQRHGGVNKCDGCTLPVEKPQRHRGGVTPPLTEGHVDHRIPKAHGGSGTPENGDLLCRSCNLKKSDGAK
jgi:hypothetical protein